MEVDKRLLRERIGALKTELESVRVHVPSTALAAPRCGRVVHVRGAEEGGAGAVHCRERVSVQPHSPGLPSGYPLQSWSHNSGRRRSLAQRRWKDDMGGVESMSESLSGCPAITTAGSLARTSPDSGVRPLDRCRCRRWPSWGTPTPASPRCSTASRTPGCWRRTSSSPRWTPPRMEPY